MLPEEFKRPAIDLHIVGANVDHNMNQCHLGVLGGIGHLSDACIIKETVGKIKESGGNLDGIALNLFSCPPPRGKKDLLKYGKEYFNKVTHFGVRRHANYALASNTAHIYRRALERITGMKPIYNSIVDVVSHIKHGSYTPEHTLVLGTTQAYKKKMYPNALGKEKLKALVPSQEEQNALQDIIDCTKQTGFGVANKEALIELIKKEVNILHAEKTISHILLGCSELSLTLGVEGMQEIETELGIKIVDSEDIFAQVFAKLVRGEKT